MLVEQLEFYMRCATISRVSPYVRTDNPSILTRYMLQKVFWLVSCEPSPYMCCVTVPNSFLREFYTATKSMTPEARGKYLENPPEGACDIEDAHKVH